VTVVRISGVNVALFNVGGSFYAINDFCMRCGASLAEGCIAGSEVTCRKCGWRYDFTTGRLAHLPALMIDRFEVQVADTRLLVSCAPRTRPH
jgi:nitrite reductase/ring-hydroxylating ferredoxin subunit